MSLFACGTILRIFISKGIYIVIIGQFLCGLASSFISNLQVKVISEWFDEKEVSAIYGYVFINFLPEGSLVNNFSSHKPTWFFAC